jgi:CRISPR-associated endonuclease Cas2
MNARAVYVVAYDIAHPRRLVRIHRYLCKVAHAMQYSVFAADLEPRELERLAARLRKMARRDEDDIRIYRVPAEPSGAWAGPTPGIGGIWSAGSPAAALARTLADARVTSGRNR